MGFPVSKIAKHARLCAHISPSSTLSPAMAGGGAWPPQSWCSCTAAAPEDGSWPAAVARQCFPLLWLWLWLWLGNDRERRGAYPPLEILNPTPGKYSSCKQTRAKINQDSVPIKIFRVCSSPSQSQPLLEGLTNQTSIQCTCRARDIA
jgi:hypothetical protein